MPKVRVLVGNSPGFMRDLVVATLENRPDIEILENSTPENPVPSELTGDIERLRPDFLLLTLEKDAHVQRRVCEELLKRFPALKILVMARHSDRCVLYRINSRVYSTAIMMSEEGILNVLRGEPGKRMRTDRALRKVS